LAMNVCDELTLLPDKQHKKGEQTTCFLYELSL
jgi:hypothetical protein